MPVIVQSDSSVLLEVASPRYREAREALLSFAELVKSPEHFHTYRITPLSIWNACSAGMEPARILATLENLARYPVPGNVAASIKDLAARFGLSAPAVSRHLSVLQHAGLVSAERQGQKVLYRLEREALLGALARFASEVDGPLRRGPREAI